jgi:hypothetical protein
MSTARFDWPFNLDLLSLKASFTAQQEPMSALTADDIFTFNLKAHHEQRHCQAKEKQKTS